MKGAHTRGKGNGEDVPSGANTHLIRKRFIAVRAVWLQSHLPEEVLLEGLQTIAGAADAVREHTWDDIIDHVFHDGTN